MNEILTALADNLGVLSEAQEAAEGRDTSLVQWRFLGDVLRHMPEQDPAVQAVIDPVIERMDMMAAGEDSPNVREAVWDLDNIIYPARSCPGARAAWYAAWAAAYVGRSDYHCRRAVPCFTHAVISANRSHYVRDRRSVKREHACQREVLLRMIAECPMKGESK